MSKSAARKPAWQNRIIGHGEMPAGQFLAHPSNWRVHPQFQQEAMGGALSEIGWVDEVTVNRRTGRIVDGHLRVTLALRQGEHTPVPYREIDVSDEEEALILATKDPIAALAVPDDRQLAAVMEDVSTADPALLQLLDELAFGATLAATEAGDSSADGRNLDRRQTSVKAVFSAAQVAIIEEAIQSAGIANRGDALTAICEAYLGERQFNV